MDSFYSEATDLQDEDIDNDGVVFNNSLNYQQRRISEQRVHKPLDN